MTRITILCNVIFLLIGLFNPMFAQALSRFVFEENADFVVTDESRPLIILNNTQESLSLDIKLDHIRNEKGQIVDGVEATSAVNVPSVLDIPASKSGSVDISLDTSMVFSAGSYSTFVVVSEKVSNGKLLRRKLKWDVSNASRDSVSEDECKSITPLVEEWTVWLRLDKEDESMWLPIEKDTDKAATNTRCLVGFAVADQHIYGEIYWAGKIEEQTGGQLGAKLNFDKLPKGYNTYEGSLNPTLSSDDSKKVTLKVYRQHHWFFPVLALTLGIITATLTQRLMREGRAKLDIKKRSAELETRIKSLNDENSPFNLSKAIHESLAEITNSLDEISEFDPSGESVKNKFTSINNLLARLDKSINEWPAFEDKLTLLRETVTEFDKNLKNYNIRRLLRV